MSYNPSSPRPCRGQEETMDDDYFELTLSDRELCELEYDKQEWGEEFVGHLETVPTDPHDELFDVNEQPWQQGE